MTNKSYTELPEIPQSVRDRYQTVLEVLEKKLTVSEGAERLGLSRPQMQTLVHRAMAGVLEAMIGGKPGRRPRPEKEAVLEEENRRLRKENERLTGRVDTVDRLLHVASDLVRGRVKTRPVKPGPTSTSTPATEETKAGGDDPEDDSSSGGGETPP